MTLRANPRVDVVILSWNDEPLVDAAVASALVSIDVDVRVFVVDNGSIPALQPKWQDDRVRVIRNAENRGVAGGRNQGVHASDAGIVCFLDSDARLEPHCLATLVGALGDPDVAVTVPVFTNQSPQQSAGRAPTLTRKLLRLCNLRSTYAGAPLRAVTVWDVDFGIGACQVFRRSAFDAVGGLDESHLFGPEDVDFCLRVRKVGSRVVQVRGARCDHPARRGHRALLTRRGMAHAAAVCRHLWRHRGTARALRQVSA
ncbi:MAG: glycosyltransferase [Acidimicrobiia bacterium]|nr:glycosyltransferase [Acidimicrobiia bacterium]